MSGREGLDTLDEAEGASFAEVKRLCSDRSGEWQQLWLVRLVGMNTMWSHLSDASRRRGRQCGEALMERRPQRGTNRGRSGMVARSTDGHKTNASLGAEHLSRVGVVKVKDAFLTMDLYG